MQAIAADTTRALPACAKLMVSYRGASATAAVDLPAPATRASATDLPQALWVTAGLLATDGLVLQVPPPPSPKHSGSLAPFSSMQHGLSAVGICSDGLSCLGGLSRAISKLSIFACNTRLQKLWGLNAALRLLLFMLVLVCLAWHYVGPRIHCMCKACIAQLICNYGILSTTASRLILLQLWAHGLQISAGTEHSPIHSCFA